MAASVREIDRQLKIRDHSYKLSLSRLLLPHLDPLGHPERLALPDEKDLQADLPSPDQLETLQINLPVATCLLTAAYKWPFDLHQNPEALLWILRRKLESSTLKGLRPDAALARFPRQLEPCSRSSATCSKTVFGPYNETGLIVDLRQCDPLDPEMSRLSVARRSKWLHYIFRQCGPLPIMHFPPLSHVVGTMVEQREFTDEVAMDVYGVFDDCSIDVLVQGGLLPVFGAAPSARGLALTTVSEGAVRLNSLSGATVLFLACLLLQVEEPVQKLLNMKVTGLVILRDMANHGLGWIMQSQDAKTIISRWIGSAEFQHMVPPPTSRVSLLLEAWMSRPDGPFSSTDRVTPKRLFTDLAELNPPAAATDDAPGSTMAQAASPAHISGGFFHGAAAGSAVALFIRSNAPWLRDNSPESFNDPEAAKAQAGKWIQNLVSQARQYSGSKVITDETADKLKGHLNEKLEGFSEDAVDKLEELDKDIRKAVGQFDAHLPGFDMKTFLKYFYRAFLVAITGGHLQDKGAGPLTWSSTSLRTEIHQDRRILLGMPPYGPATMRAPEAPKPKRWLPRTLLVVFACILTFGAILWPSRLPSLKAHPGMPQALAGSDIRVGLGMVQASFRAASTMHVKEGEQVYILGAEYDDWYKIENLNGDIGVSTTVCPRLTTAGPQALRSPSAALDQENR